AETKLAAGETALATAALRECANREPISPRCEGRLGLILAESPRRRAAATYFITAAAAHDDAKADAQFYIDLAVQLRRWGKYEEGAGALKFALARTKDDPELHARYSAMLQAIPERTVEAADELAKARALR